MAEKQNLKCINSDRAFQESDTIWFTLHLLRNAASWDFSDYVTEAQAWKDSLEKRLKRRKKGVRFGTWNIRSLYMVGLLVSYG
jgi:hypothetical protein